MTNKKEQKSMRSKRSTVSYRMVAIMVLGIFVLLLSTTLITTALTAVVAKYWNIDEENILLFGVIVLAISIVIGIGLSVAYSAIMVKTSEPYLHALQKIADCDFSVRIEDGPLLSGLGIAKSFNEMANRLASVETLREDFVSNFSHEFKTPIVSISGFATLLKNPNLSKEERNEYLDVIINESNRLVRLSESVLMLTRLNSQTVVNEKFLLDEQIRQSMLLFQNACETKNIELSADLEEITVENERKLLNQIWVNLLSNAVKFTGNGGKIEVSAKKEDNKVTVKVTDNGCGMSEETQKNIFSKFYQGDTSHATEGNGLGLSVVKKICDLLNLKISVESSVGVGTTFTVEFDCGQTVKNNTTKLGGANESNND